MKQKTIFTLREKISLSCTTLCFAAALLCCLYGSRTGCIFFLLALALHNLFILCPAGKREPEKNETVPENKNQAEKAALCALEAQNKNLTARITELMAENKHCAQTLEAEKSLRPSCILPDTGHSRLTLLDLAAFSRDMLREFEALPAYTHVKSCVQCESEELIIAVDKSLLRLLFGNLLDNAFKNLACSGRLHGRLTLTLTEEPDGALVIFRDNGPGISTEELSHIFERNYQGSNRISGTGLGLFQAKWIVESMGGALTVKSTPDSGFAAYLNLPAPEEENPRSREKKDNL